ncbi:hypothetical protein HXA35_19130 [Bacillus sp. A301a_S52]|jgi:hypothetical protein|nr:hypothetical protein [Bacillus sp. A301a_S52]
MMVEFYQDFLPVLITVSLYMTFAGAHMIRFMAHDSAAAGRFIMQKKLPSWHTQLLPEKMLEDRRGARLSWLTKMTGRKEGPEDDSDYLSSKKSRLLTLRGGFTWEKYLYSLVIKRPLSSLQQPY